MFIVADLVSLKFWEKCKLRNKLILMIRVCKSIRLVMVNACHIGVAPITQLRMCEKNSNIQGRSLNVV